MQTPGPLPPPTTAQLVSAACALKLQIAGALDDLAKIEAKLIELGAGKYTGLTDGESVTVLAESIGKDKMVLLPANVERARELADKEFRKLFTPATNYVPCKAFEEIVPKLLTPACAKKLIALCATPTPGKKAHCRDYRFAPIA